MNSNPSQNEKNEIIEQALLESIGGGRFDTSRIPLPGDCYIPLCSITCSTETK